MSCLRSGCDDTLLALSSECSLAIQHNVKNARQAADDKYAHLTTFMTDMDSQLTALLHDSKRSRDAGKKGFGADLSSALFVVEEA